ncbi:MAG TPA: hypothetical protein VKE98_00100, partial [Gemmataceae bacterium]|nr:hypothetical protein [Gemmataceae bacterium]
LSPLEWLGMGILLVGTILLSTSASSGSAPILHLYRLLLFLAGSAVVCMLILGCSLVLKVQHAEFAFGTIVGLLFGSGYLATKTVFLAWQENRSMLAALAFLAMGAGMLGGLAVLLWSFRRGRALIIRGVNFVVNQVMVVLGGAYCLGESFPEEPLLLLARFAGFAAIVLGALLLLAAGRKSPVGAA